MHIGSRFSFIRNSCLHGVCAIRQIHRGCYCRAQSYSDAYSIQNKTKFIILYILRTSFDIIFGGDQFPFHFFLDSSISTVIWLLAPILPRWIDRSASEDERAMNRTWVLLELRSARTKQNNNVSVLRDRTIPCSIAGT